MKKILIIFFTVAQNMIYQPNLFARYDCSPFTAPPPFHFSTDGSLKITSFDGSIDGEKVMLKWTVNENEEAEQFQVERSADGKHFTMAALVFGTDKPGAGSYEFFEKRAKKKVSYRLKVIQKNGITSYSDIIIARRNPVSG